METDERRNVRSLLATEQRPRRWEKVEGRGGVGWDRNFIDASEFISSVMMGAEYPSGIRTPKEEERSYVTPQPLSSAESRAEDHQPI